MIKTYLGLCLNGLKTYATDLSYKNVSTPVYRGLKPEAIDSLKDYELGSIGLWPQFSSTSRNRDISYSDFARIGVIPGTNHKVRILCKIYLTC